MSGEVGKPKAPRGTKHTREPEAARDGARPTKRGAGVGVGAGAGAGGSAASHGSPGDTDSAEDPAPGTVYIAAKNMRGAWAVRPLGAAALVVDVTSAQAKTSLNRVAFSPMHMKPYSDPTGAVDSTRTVFPNFEAFWQSGKKFKDVTREKVVKFWTSIDKPKRRYPGSKRFEVEHAQWGTGPRMGYAESRKQVYVPLYHDLIKDSERTVALRKAVQNGQDVVIYDFDGPRDDDGTPLCLPVTAALLRDKIEDVRTPFGHGYVVAALLAGVDPSEFI